MIAKTLQYYKQKANFESHIGKNDISLDLFLELLEVAENMKKETEVLYGKLHLISNILTETRNEIK